MQVLSAAQQALQIETPAGSLCLSVFKAAYSADHKALFVADVHMGKASSFRQLGVPVPHGTSADNLDRLSQAIDFFQPEVLFILGDFLHSKLAQHRALLDQVTEWSACYPGLRKVLVRGNHDDAAGDPPQHTGIDLMDEPFLLGQFALCHYPQNLPGAYTLSGHLHPGVVLAGAARSRLRLPCFYQQAQGLVLPAFGAFTGLAIVRPKEGEAAYPVVNAEASR